MKLATIGCIQGNMEILIRVRRLRLDEIDR